MLGLTTCPDLRPKMQQASSEVVRVAPSQKPKGYEYHIFGCRHARANQTNDLYACVLQQGKSRSVPEINALEEAMIIKRETPDDRKREERLLQVMAKHLGLSYKQNPNTNKYRIDGWFYHDQGSGKGLLAGWAECKWYTGKPHLFLNVPKYMELINLAESSGVPSYFIFRKEGAWGYAVLHDGYKRSAQVMGVIDGGTPFGREPNEDDIEPLMVVISDSVRWMA